MARIVIVCPFCQKRLETPDENLGRQGQCPGCQNVFIIKLSDLGAAGERLAGSAPEYEYQEMGALSGVGAVAVCLVLLALASLLQWVPPDPTKVGADFMPSEKLAFAAVSMACCVCLAVSFLARKSLVPGVLTGAAWGMVALIWTGGILVTFHNAVKRAQNTDLAETVAKSIHASAGIYLALAASILTIIAATFFYYQCRDSDTFRRIGAFLVATQVLAVIAGLVIVFTHVKPAIQSGLPRRPTLAAPSPQTPGPPTAPESSSSS